MSEEKDNRFIPFIIGLFMGWVGVKIIVHAVYISIILTLLTLLILKK